MPAQTVSSSASPVSPTSPNPFVKYRVNNGPVSPASAASNATKKRTASAPSTPTVPKRSRRSAGERQYTLDEAKRFIADMPPFERQRIDAYIELDSFAKAGRQLGIDEETVSRTWKKYKRLIKMVALDAQVTKSTKPN